MTDRPDDISDAAVADRLLGRLRAHDLVLFCGAGVSMDPPATLPDWSTFRDETIKAVASAYPPLVDMVAKLTGQEILGARGEALAPELVATEVSRVNPDYFQSLRAMDHDQPNRNHELIAALVASGLVQHVVTTNFDQLIERALANRGVDPLVVRSDDDYERAAQAWSTETRPVVLKLHGCLSRPETIVATIEQEAVGLSIPRAFAMQHLLARHHFLFWGYSGADLKIDLDYLKMASEAPTAKGFFWNLYATPAYREEPNAWVTKLVTAYADRAAVCHLDLSRVFAELLPPEAVPSPATVDSDAVAALRESRNRELTTALQAWAARSLEPALALEIFGGLNEHVRENDQAASCFDRIVEIGLAGGSSAITALGFSRGAELALRVGAPVSDGTVEEVLRLADDRACSVGAVDLLLVNARAYASRLSLHGRVLDSTQPREFARLVAQWASPRAVPDVLSIDLDGAEHLLELDLELGFARLAEVEARARAAGRLGVVADALERRSRALMEWSDRPGALEAAKAALDIAKLLGRHGDARLLEAYVDLLEDRSADEPTTSEKERGAESASAVTERIERLVRASLDAQNERFASEIVLDALETCDVAPEDALRWLERVEAYVTTGGEHLRVRLAARKAIALSQVERYDEAYDVLDAVAPQLVQAVHNPFARDLYRRHALLAVRLGMPDVELVPRLMTAARVARRRNELDFAIERALGEARGRSRPHAQPLDFDAELAAIEENVAGATSFVAQMAGLPSDETVGADLASAFGEDGRFTWVVLSMVSTARTCLEQGELDAGLALGTACLALSQRLDDANLCSESHEVIGSARFLAGEHAAARQSFEEAIALDRAAHDLPSLIRDLISAAKASEAENLPSDAATYWNELDAVARESQHVPTALQSALRAGEVLKTLGRHEDSARCFGRAVYLARALGDHEGAQQAHLRLGKLYLETGQPERSIAHRLAVADAARAREEYGTVASFALLVGNTYDETLARPHDALPYYREAVEAADRVPQLPNRELMEQRLESCRATLEGRPDPPLLRSVLIEATGSEPDAERVAAALALTVDYDLWDFELRSFCAWFERAFGQLPAVSAASVESIPAWPAVAAQSVAELETGAREVHSDELAQAAARAQRLLLDIFGQVHTAPD
jgi:tetratricopeptide (TPR) repeat protein